MKSLVSGELGEGISREVKKMPDTLCRKCGAELERHSKCPECLQTIQEVCPKCQYISLEKFHMVCMVMSGERHQPGRQIQEVLAV